MYISRVLSKAKSKFLWAALLCASVLLCAGDALAGTNVSTVAENLVDSSFSLPGAVTGFAYLLGTVFAAWGIISIKSHVESPQQMPLRNGIIKILVGGMLFAMPYVTGVMLGSVDDAGGNLVLDNYNLKGTVSKGESKNNVNTVLGNIEESAFGLPGLVSAACYLLGLLAAFAGLLKLKETVENPQQIQMKEPITRFLFGGAMFAIPTVYRALNGSIKGADNGVIEYASAAIVNLKTTYTVATGGTAACSNSQTGGANVAEVICNTISGVGLLPGIFMGLAYLMALFFGVWGIMKLRDHALMPQQTSIWEGVMRLLAAACFSALPMIIDAMFFSLFDAGAAETTNSTFNGKSTGSGLDAMLEKFMGHVFGPTQILITWFGMLVGTILIMIGINRLIKSTQEGAKSPIGMGTMMTFLTGAMLVSFSPMMASVSDTFFDSGQVKTFAKMQYVTGMDQDVQDHSHSVISSILQFMMVLGLISFARGIFIMRAVAEGNSQASMMAGLTHIVGGAFAVNLGPLMNAIQTTLGLQSYGVMFS